MDLYGILQFETTRFRLLHYEQQYDKHLFPGRDVVCWLSAHLQAMGYRVGLPRLSGRNWTIDVAGETNRYLIGVVARRLEATASLDRGCWRIVIEKPRTTWQRALFLGKLQADDPLIVRINELLCNQYDFKAQNKRFKLFSP